MSQLDNPIQYVESRFNLQLKRVGRTEWAGPCPWCGGTDRFHVWDRGNYWCRPGPGHCGKSGWLDEMDGTNPPTKEQILELWSSFEPKPQELGLPSAPQPFLKYFEEENRPQTRLDREYENGMGVTIGRLREDLILGWRFVCLSHNTLRGAAGGGVLTAELLKVEGYLQAK